MTAGLCACVRASLSVRASVNQCVGVSGSRTVCVFPCPKASALLHARIQNPSTSLSLVAVLQQIVWRNSELIVWFHASSFKQGSHMAPCTVKWAILWRGQKQMCRTQSDAGHASEMHSPGSLVMYLRYHFPEDETSNGGLCQTGLLTYL